MAGPPPSRPSSASDASEGVLRDGRDDPQPFGDVLDDEADDQEGAERRRADAVGRADRQPFAEIVQPDAERDHRGERHTLLAPPRLLSELALADRVEQQEGADDADADEPRALERAAERRQLISSASVARRCRGR